MKNVMTKAWEIARKGQENFGGQVKEYIAQALRMAWALIKKGGNKKMAGMMTQKQDRFIVKLMNEVETAGIDPLNVVGARDYLQQGTYATTKQEASDLISALLEAKENAPEASDMQVGDKMVADWMYKVVSKKKQKKMGAIYEELNAVVTGFLNKMNCEDKLADHPEDVLAIYRKHQ